MSQSPTATASKYQNTAATMAQFAGKKSIMVHVVGAVRNPGVLVLPASTRVIEAIERVGGATSEADIQALNLAAILKDGQQITVPTRSTSLFETSSTKSGLAAGAKQSQPRSSNSQINVNTASASELEALPGVGPAIAARIVQHREQHGAFKQVEDLDAVKGIGAAKLEQLRGSIVF